MLFNLSGLRGMEVRAFQEIFKLLQYLGTVHTEYTGDRGNSAATLRALPIGERISAKLVCMPVEAPLRTRSPLLGFATGLAVGAVVVALLATVLWAAGAFAWMRLALGFGPTRVLVGRPTVVLQIQKLQRLQTVSFTLEKILAGERNNPYLPPFLAGERLLLVVHGDATAGIDLAKLKVEDVTVNRRSAAVRLPEPELFAVRIDNEKTQVYSRATGVFSGVDPQLETEVRREGERQLRQAALQNNILEIARQNARSTVESLLRGLGFEQIEVR
jgi:hypothetical protein